MLESVGSRVRELRRAKGFTQRVLAERAGMYHTTISELERGVTTPSADTLAKIAAVLQVQPGDFFPPAHHPKNKS